MCPTFNIISDEGNIKTLLCIFKEYFYYLYLFLALFKLILYGYIYICL